jgi:hypothetical protein
LLIYTADRYMSATLSLRNRPRFGTEDFDGGTDEEKRRAYENFLSYSGRFEVNETRRTIEHHVAMSSYPNFVGRTLERLYELSEEKLTLTIQSINVGNQSIGSYLCWQRL